MMFSRTVQDDRLSLAFFGSIVIALIPVIISARVVPGFSQGSAYPYVVAAAFVLQSVLVLWLMLQSRFGIPMPYMLTGLLLAASPSVTLAVSVFSGAKVASFDFAYPFARLLSVMLFFVLPSGFSVSKRGLEKFMRCMVWLGIVACLFNLAVNHREIMTLLTVKNPYATNMSSFFVGRNGFAQLLTLAIIANTFLMFSGASYSQRFLYVNYFLFGVNQLMTLSRASIGSTIGFLLLLYLTRTRRRLAAMIRIACALACAVVLLARIEPLRDFVTTMLLRPDRGVMARVTLWEVGIDLLRKSNWLVGVGYQTASNVLSGMGYSTQFHNALIAILVGGGVLDLISHVLVFLILGRLIMASMSKHDPDSYRLYIAAYGALVVAGLVESVSVFSIGYADILVTVFFITVPLLYSRGLSRRGSAVPN